MLMNAWALAARSDADAVAVSMKITDSPGAMLVTPFNGTDTANEFELSSIVQPTRLTDAVPKLVTSNQSRASGLLPLDQGAASVIARLIGPPPPAGVIARGYDTLASGVAPTEVLSPSPSSATKMSASLTGAVVFVFSGSDVTAPSSETAVGARFAAVEGA